MVRTASYDINGVKKGDFSPEEDDKLKGFIERNNGPGKWLQLPRLAGLSRTGKSCRLRWMNYLRPNVKRGNYTEEEDDLIIKLQEEIGNKWCVIASNLPGRTDNDIKNHWHTKLKKKRVMRNAIASKEVEKDQSIEPYVFESSNKNKKKEGQEHKTVDVDYDTLNILESSQVSSEPYSSITKAPSSSSEAHELSSAVNMAAVDSAANSSDVFSGLSRDDFWTKPYLADSYWYDDIASTLCTDDEISLMAGMWWMQYTH